MVSRTDVPGGTGLLVHGAWGLRPWEGRPLPLDQRDLPESYLRLGDAEQDRIMDSALAALFDWARVIGCSHVRAEVPLERDYQVLTDAGLSAHECGAVEGSFKGEVARALLLVDMPERVWIRRHEALVIYVHETWDSVVVMSDEVSIEALRGLIDEAATP